MNNKLVLLAIAASTLTLGACTSTQQKAETLPPGQYQNTTKSVNANGTETTKKTSTDVTVDQYGNKKAVVETQTSKDPKGLFNKSTSTSKTTVNHY